MLDNDVIYMQHLEGIIDSVDELASMEAVKTKDAIRFRIAPSLPKYIPILLEELLKFHTLYHIKLDLGKSIKSSSTIVFSINLNQ